MTFLEDNINHLGDMNIITIKLREHLMDAHIGIYSDHTSIVITPMDHLIVVFIERSISNPYSMYHTYIARDHSNNFMLYI